MFPRKYVKSKLSRKRRTQRREIFRRVSGEHDNNFFEVKYWSRGYHRVCIKVQVIRECRLCVGYLLDYCSSRRLHKIFSKSRAYVHIV